MAIEHLWAGWRTDYVASGGQAGPGDDGCVFCRILASGEPDETTKILWRGDHALAILNAYPYTSGHVMVLPSRHVAELEDLTEEESTEIWGALTVATRAIKSAYGPDGLNVGANLGRAAGAGVPGHFHVHLVPRWTGDTNFMTSVADVRVLPETLDASWQKLRAAWSVP